MFTTDLEGKVLPALAELERLLGGSREDAVAVVAKAGSLLSVSAQLLRSSFQFMLERGLSEEEAR